RTGRRPDTSTAPPNRAPGCWRSGAVRPTGTTIPDCNRGQAAFPCPVNYWSCREWLKRSSLERIMPYRHERARYARFCQRGMATGTDKPQIQSETCNSCTPEVAIVVRKKTTRRGPKIGPPWVVEL